MTMTVADEKIEAAAEEFRRVGVRKLQDSYRAGFALSSDEVFAVLFQPELAGAAARLEKKYGTPLFDEARDGRSRELGELLAGDRDELHQIALTITS